MMIAQTGELPAAPSRDDKLSQQQARFTAFEAWLGELPQPHAEYAHLSDEEILATKVSRYV